MRVKVRVNGKDKREVKGRGASKGLGVAEDTSAGEG